MPPTSLTDLFTGAIEASKTMTCKAQKSLMDAKENMRVWYRVDLDNYTYWKGIVSARNDTVEALLLQHNMLVGLQHVHKGEKAAIEQVLSLRK